MWNFTGRALVIPFLSDSVKLQMQNKEYISQSQKDVLKLDCSDILYNAENEEDKVFEKYSDYYILSAMDKAYNGLPNTKKNLGKMNESEFNKWLSTSDFSKPKKSTKSKFQWWKKF